MSKSRLSRRYAVPVSFLAMAGLAMLPSAVAAPTSRPTIEMPDPGAATSANSVISPTTAIKASAFVDSVGVGIHLKEPNSSYTDYAKVKAALLDLGVHNVRDSLSGPVASEILDLGRSGIKVSATVPRAVRTDADLNKVLNVAEQWRPALSSIGGPNELDAIVSNWPSVLKSIQSRLYSKVKADPALRSVPVLGPSLRTASNEHLLGDISNILDFGAVHGYPYGQMPEDKAPGYMAEARVNAGNKPVVISETGMSNASDSLRRQYDLPYSPRAAQIYTPRLVLEYYRLGAAKTYLYQLLNEDNVSSVTPRERYYGLMNKDFTPKPSYIALRNLLKALADSGSNYSTTSLNYSVSSSASVRQMLFQKGNGDYYIAVWRPVSVWKSGGANGQDLYPSPVSATLNLPTSAQSVQIIDIQKGLTPTRTVQGAQHVQFDVLPSVQLLKVTM